MLNALNLAEIIISVALIIVILLQQQGSGLGTMFGGAGGESYRSKRGAEAVLFNLTIVLVTLFIVVGVAIAVVSANA
ncbi:MAG: preprotein translocase subunit SecG [candidate division WS6 bacterium OLB20]|uniref:Protein-export membrane protein SecG n=1 Tax=candidate division WS6 bacterium OLB20 TaxID=1617426 RepID=A0A136LW25_9BACT|nr:MAG: preprotein translocase subunit SecG [candidate division WS6 bacterium OLB20]